MYTLRRVLKNGMVMNESLGDGYNFVPRLCREEFEKITTKWWGDPLPPEEKNIYAYIICNNGATTIPLESACKYFVMTESGKTFERL